MQAGEIHLPMIGADGERIKSPRPYAQRVRRMTGYPIQLVRFTQRDENRGTILKPSTDLPK
jgi:hypothetical protein